jgi:hypothetical protein
MNRREVLAGLLLAFITESAQAQQSGRSKVYRIAFVDPQTPVAEQRENPMHSGFFEELRREYEFGVGSVAGVARI